MKNTDPRIKLLSVLMLTAGAMLINSPGAAAVLTGAAVLTAMLFGSNPLKFAVRIRGAAALLLLAAFCQTAFVRDGEPLIKVFGLVFVYKKGALAAAAAALRYMTLIVSMSIMAEENPRRVIQGLVQMRVPYVFVFMLNTALRFLPFFSESMRDALVAVQLRGIELKKLSAARKIKLYMYLILPVAADAVIKAQELAIAMELRGFGAYRRRTSMYTLRLGASDIALLIILPVLFISACLFLLFCANS